MADSTQPEKDPSTFTEEEKAIFAKYGNLPKQNDLIKKRQQERLKGKARFDSADWELKKSQPNQFENHKESKDK